MRSLEAVIRMGLAIAALLFGALAILLVTAVPWKIKRASLAGWGTTYLARFIMRLLNIEANWHNKSLFLAHEGFIFPNHISYADILIMASLTPVRFLAKAEIARWPLVGQIARAIGCVFVKREDKASRSAARRKLGGLARFPPIILFPEGGTGPPGELRPFRYGAFEIVIAGQVPFLPCIIDYGPDAEAVYWGDENLFQSIYRQLTRSKGRKVFAHIRALRPVIPQPDDEPKLLAITVRGSMEGLRQSQGEEARLIQPGL